VQGIPPHPSGHALAPEGVSRVGRGAAIATSGPVPGQECVHISTGLV